MFLFQKSGQLMDTTVIIKIVTEKSAELVEEKLTQAFSLWQEIAERLTRFSETSELNQLIKQSRGRFFPVSPLLFYPIKFSLKLAAKTHGLFDPTIADYLAAYGYDAKVSLKKKEQVLQLLKNKRTDYRSVEINETDSTVKLSPLMKLDLGGVAKGYSLDLIGKFLDEFDNYCLEAGGDILTKGVNVSGQPWRIGIRDPRISEEQLLMALPINNQAICTSSRTIRKTDTWHHIINPLTGDSPYELLSATVLAKTAIIADAYSTIVMLLGKEKGREFLQNEGLQGILVTSLGEVIRINSKI